jgi:calcineurin-like phosphoesterase family protein
MKIFEYYRKAIISFSSLILVIMVLIVISGKFNLNEIINIVYLIIGASIVLGTLYYIYDTYFGPKERIKELKKYPFNEFEKIGFKNNKDYLVGKINGYTIITGYNWRNDNGLPCVYGIILFDPRLNGKHLNNYLLEKWQQSIKNEYNFWEYGSLKTEWNFINGKPNHKSIIAKLKKNSNLISNKGMNKISIENWKNEIEKHYQNINN